MAASDLLSVIERSVGVYGTAPTCYLSALARVPDLTIEQFDSDVASGGLVRIRAMRYSVHTLSVGLLPVVGAATRSLTRKSNARRRPVEDMYESVAGAIDAALAPGPHHSRHGGSGLPGGENHNHGDVAIRPLPLCPLAGLAARRRPRSDR